MSKKASITIVIGAFLTVLMVYLPFAMAGVVPINTGDCTICHLDMIDAHATVGDDCTACHIPIAHQETPKDCAICHGVTATRKSLHIGTVVGCAECHTWQWK